MEAGIVNKQLTTLLEKEKNYTAGLGFKAIMKFSTEWGPSNNIHLMNSLSKYVSL